MTDQAPPEVTTKITHVGGLEIIAREPAVAPHPDPRKGGKLVPFAGIEKILLEGGAETHMCDCGKTGDSVRSLVAHRNGTHNRKKPHHPLHDEKTLAKVIQIATTERARALRGYPQRTVAELTRLGIRTLNGKPWTDAMVTSIYGHYKDKYPARPSRSRTLRAVPEPVVTTAPTTVVPEIDLGGIARLLPESVHDLARAIRGRLDELSIMVAQLAAMSIEPDPTIVEKARRYDALKQNLTGDL